MIVHNGDAGLSFDTHASAEVRPRPRGGAAFLVAAAARNFATSYDLSDQDDLQALRADSYRVLSAAKTPILIDEAQLLPELPSTIKRLVDRSLEAGQFLLTGSSRIGRGSLGGSDPLAGRAARVTLHPFTQGELAGTMALTSVVEQWWDRDISTATTDEIGLDELAHRILRGGLPTIALPISSPGQRPPINEHPALSNYDQGLRRAAYIEGVLHLALSDTRVVHARLLQTFRYLSANPARILNVNRAASESGVSAATIKSDIEIATSAFLLQQVFALRPSQHQTAISHPRLFTHDVGLAAWAANASPERIIHEPTLRGAFLEALVFHELSAQTAWSVEPVDILHWRDTRARREVDLVLRRSDGRAIGVEVKAASSVSTGDTRGLTALADRLGPLFHLGVVLHTGRFTHQLDDKIWAAPITSLWTRHSSKPS